jgi:hypothetical protein
VALGYKLMISNLQTPKIEKVRRRRKRKKLQRTMLLLAPSFFGSE